MVDTIGQIRVWKSLSTDHHEWAKIHSCLLPPPINRQRKTLVPAVTKQLDIQCLPSSRPLVPWDGASGKEAYLCSRCLVLVHLGHIRCVHECTCAWYGLQSRIRGQRKRRTANRSKGGKKSWGIEMAQEKLKLVGGVELGCIAWSMATYLAPLP